MSSKNLNSCAKFFLENFRKIFAFFFKGIRFAFFRIKLERIRFAFFVEKIFAFAFDFMRKFGSLVGLPFLLFKSFLKSVSHSSIIVIQPTTSPSWAISQLAKWAMTFSWCGITAVSSFSPFSAILKSKKYKKKMTNSKIKYHLLTNANQKNCPPCLPWTAPSQSRLLSPPLSGQKSSLPKRQLRLHLKFLLMSCQVSILLFLLSALIFWFLYISDFDFGQEFFARIQR